MLQHYYDILAKNKFDALFDDLYIGKQMCIRDSIEAADDLRELIKANSRLLDMLYKRIELLENKVLL